MASDASTHPAVGLVRFSPDFVSHIPSYQKAIRSHRVARWARARGLEDDLVQLALMDLARVESRFDPARASSPHHYRMAVLGTRVSDCFDHLNRMHGLVVDFDDNRMDVVEAEDAAEFDSHTADDNGHRVDDHPLADAIYEQLIRVLAETLQRVPAGQRRVLELALVEHSDREIAEQLGISIQAVNTARRKGISKIQGALRAGHYLN